MSFLSLLLALLIEQARPLVRGNWVHGTVRSWANWISQTLDAGHPRLAWTTWSLAVGLPAVIATLVHWFLIGVFGWPVAMIWSVAVLYVTLGFRQFSFHFTLITAHLPLLQHVLPLDCSFSICDSRLRIIFTTTPRISTSSR